MKKENKLEKIKGYLPKVVTKNYITGLFDEIEQAERQADGYLDEKKQAIKDKASLEQIKNKEIHRLENTIKDLQKEISEKNDSLEKTIIEKEQKTVELFAKSEQIGRFESKFIKSRAAQGGLTKKNNSLRKQLEEKAKIIADYKTQINQLKEKNEIQKSQIQELSKKVKHIMPEYQNSGLPKPTRKTFSRKRG